MNRTQICRQLLYMMRILCSREERFGYPKGYYITSAKFKATFLELGCDFILVFKATIFYEPYSNLSPIAVYDAHFMQ